MAHVHPSFPPAPVPHQPSPLGFGFAFPRGSHYAPSASSPGGTPPPGGSTSAAGGGSFGSPLRRNGSSFASPSFPIAAAGQQQGGLASFGFGFGGGGSPAGPSSTAPGSSPGGAGRPTASFHRQPSSAAGTPPPLSGPSRRRGRDDLSDSSGGDDDDDEAADRASNRAPVRPMRGMKRSKTDDVFGPSGTFNGSRSTGQNGRSQAGSLDCSNEASAAEEPDLGVLLALLPPSSLLPILTSLVQRHPQLKPDLLALLPQPSLAVALDALRAAETRIRSAVPFGWDAQRPGGGVSEHYVVGRIQESVGEMVSLVQSHLPIFLPSSAVTIQSASPTRPPPHPTDQFSYLQQTTALLVRLSTSLPHLAAVDVLWARLSREWVRWAETVARWVNTEGGMVGAGVADTWMRDLDLLADGGLPSTARNDGRVLNGSSAAKTSSGAGSAVKIRNEMGLVRDKWVRECGWLVGRRLAQPQHLDVGMEEEEL